MFFDVRTIICFFVRKRVELMAAEEKGIPEDLCGLCGICSAGLDVLFDRFNFDSHLVQGEFVQKDIKNIYGLHFWVVSDDRIYDITASQFDLPNICIFTEKNREYQYYEEIDRDADYEYFTRHWRSFTSITKSNISKVILGVEKEVKHAIKIGCSSMDELEMRFSNLSEV